jgi:hypothetical protein
MMGGRRASHPTWSLPYTAEDMSAKLSPPREGEDASGGTKGEDMSVTRKISQLICWSLIAVIAMLLGSTIAIAAGESREPPMGLAEVKPTAPMPVFKLPGVNGEAFDSSTLQGKVVVVRFWATW